MDTARWDNETDESTRQLSLACERGDVEAVRRLLDEGVPIDGSMRDYGSHFDVALRAFRYKLDPRRSNERASGADVDDPVGVIRLLLARGIDVNKTEEMGTTNGGRTPLYSAVWIARDLDVIRLLLAHGADPNLGVHPPLTLAVGEIHGSVALCRLLLAHGADVECVNPYLTPRHAEQSRFVNPYLWSACLEHDQPDIALLLLDRGVDVNRKTQHSRHTPMYLAASRGKVSMVRALLSRGADADFVFQEHTQAPQLKAIDAARRAAAAGMPCREGTWEELIALLDSAPPARVRIRSHWHRRILFHVISRRSSNPNSARHELGRDMVSVVASFLMAAE